MKKSTKRKPIFTFAAEKKSPSKMKFLSRFLRRWYQRLPRNEFDGRILWGRYLFLKFRNLCLWFLGVSVGLTILFAFLPVPFTPLMFIRTWEQAWDSDREIHWQHDWESLENISPHLQLAVVCSEDQEFLEHEGFDFDAIQKAYKYNKTHKRKRGASTISQQTAKNVFLWPSRSWIRKGLEVYFTFLVELVWSKERIMEIYLNSIEFGDGIYGAEAAAKFFFQKTARDLNRQESAMLAAVLPNPIIYSAAKPTSKTTQRRDWIISQMRMWGGKIDFENPNTPEKK